jgi:arsenite methyltransferase
MFLPLCALLFLGAQRGQRDPAEYIKLLESERRIEGLQVKHVIETLKLKPGQKVADLGSGSGLFTRPMAQQVGAPGMVYAIDIDAALLKHVDQTARDQGLANVRTVLAAEDDPKLPEPVDLIAIIDTLHHISNRAIYLNNLKRYLRPGGRIAIIDFSETWPAGHEAMKYSLTDLEGWMKAAGYQQAEKHDFLDNNFFVIYQVK